MNPEKPLPPDAEQLRRWSPADTISSVSFVASAIGAAMLDRPSGVLLYGAGRVGDLVDGAVARRTYSSKHGAKIDATLDKLAMTAGLGAAIYYDAAPQSVLAIIAAHNVINAVSNVYVDRKGLSAETSRAGKYSMFGHNLTFGAFVLGNAMENSGLTTAGWGLLAATEPFAVKASLEYGKKAINSSRTIKQHKQQRR